MLDRTGTPHGLDMCHIELCVAVSPPSRSSPHHPALLTIMPVTSCTPLSTGSGNSSEYHRQLQGFQQHADPIRTRKLLVQLHLGICCTTVPPSVDDCMRALRTQSRGAAATTRACARVNASSGRARRMPQGREYSAHCTCILSHTT